MRAAFIVSSLFLVRDSIDLELITRKQSDTPYLFHDGHYHPGRYTLETTRGGSAPMSALANLRLFGKNGLRSLLGHLGGLVCGALLTAAMVYTPEGKRKQWQVGATVGLLVLLLVLAFVRAPFL